MSLRDIILKTDTEPRMCCSSLSRDLYLSVLKQRGLNKIDCIKTEIFLYYAAVQKRRHDSAMLPNQKVHIMVDYGPLPFFFLSSTDSRN